ncbi:MAG: putative toxin-antitoxin system toxin component, PIN family [Anaerolineae bacterium]|nr:putative toxin-antitoxin system toxin component, PIN family [Anaerolineae bacterium]
MTKEYFGVIFDTMRVVVDTNILVAALRSGRGASALFLRLIPDHRFQLCLSLPLYFEYLDVALRPEHRLEGLSEQQIVSAIRYLTAQSYHQEIYFHWRPFLPDSSDDMVLELAVAAQAQYIITFNIKDFRGIERFGVTAIKPRDFLVTIGELK